MVKKTNTENEENVVNMEENLEAVDVVSFEDTDENGEVSMKDKIKKLREKLDVKEKEAKEYLDGWQRAKADLVNNERRLKDERVEIIKMANASLVEELLPTLDGYEMAKANQTLWESVDAKWRVGIEYLFQNLENVLMGQSLSKVNIKIGDKFDVNAMQAVGEIETDDEAKDGNVAQVIQSGYLLSGKLIREAKVKVFLKK